MEASDLLESLIGKKTLVERLGGIDVEDVLKGKDLFDTIAPYRPVGAKSVPASTFSGSLSGTPGEDKANQGGFSPAEGYQAAVRNLLGS